MEGRECIGDVLDKREIWEVIWLQQAESKSQELPEITDKAVEDEEEEDITCLRRASKSLTVRVDEEDLLQGTTAAMEEEPGLEKDLDFIGFPLGRGGRVG